MKINALFIENSSNFGNPQFAGYVERFDDVAELCAYALPNFFNDKKACSLFAKKLRECFDARGDEEGFFDSIVQTRLYGWANTWKIVKDDITIYVIKNLVNLDALKPNSGANESLVDEAAKTPRDFIKYSGSKYSPLSDEEEKMVDRLKDDLKIDLWYSSFNMGNKWFINAKTDFKELCHFLKSTCGYKLTEDGLKRMIEWLNDKDHSLEAYREENGGQAIYYADKKAIDEWEDKLLIAKFRNMSNR